MRSNSARNFAIFAVLWFAFVMFTGITRGDLGGYDSAAYAFEAREMIASGDLWTPHFNGHPDFDKPPLFIWIVAFTFKIFGISDPSSRIPCILFGAGIVLLTYLIVRRAFAAETSGGKDEPDLTQFAALSAAILATTQTFTKYSANPMTDVPFTFFFTAAIYFYLRSIKKDDAGHGPELIIAGVMIGLSNLMRMPFGFMAYLAIAVHIAYCFGPRSLFRKEFAGFTLMSFGLPSVWYLHEYFVYGQAFIDAYFRNISAHASAAGDESFTAKAASYLAYIPKIVTRFVPWIPVVLIGLFFAVKDRVLRHSRFAVLLLIWFLIVLVPFSIASVKEVRYILPIYPVLAIVAGYAVLRCFGETGLRRIRRVVASAMIAIFLVVAFVPNYRIRAEDMHTLGPLTDEATPVGERIIMYTAGIPQWDRQNELLWYGHRYIDLFTSLDQAAAEARRSSGRTIVVDKPSLQALTALLGTDVLTVGESDAYAAIRVNFPEN